MAVIDPDTVSTLGELKAAGWVARPVKQEVREHAIENTATARGIRCTETVCETGNTRTGKR